MDARARTIALAAGLWLLVGCHRADDVAPVTTASDGSTRSDPRHARPPASPDAAVVLTPPAAAPARVQVEVVSTPQEVRRGLMYRQHLPADQGMLFLMDREKIHTFWMKNTLIPLDMIFIGRDMVVAGVVENTEPLTTRQYWVDRPSLYVLEVNGGWAAEHGVGAGAAVEFERVGR